ncbi:MAG TPA: GHMP kinase, partial [Planctomycetota bacterium]|nr:GHMP kinase [Planctomycetota bacterium]
MKQSVQMQTRDQFFAGGTGPIVHASAPGRLDVMGGIADYSGSLVLQMPIAERTQVWLRKRTDGVIRVHSPAAARLEHAAEISLRLADLTVFNRVKTYAVAQSLLRKTPGGDWAAYVIGCFLVLRRERRLSMRGADVYIESTVPFGKGVSSSAAVEVATMNAIARAWNLSLGATELPILAQQVENQVVGAPCGLMDQLASHLGRANRLLPILCQPDQVGPALTIPRGVAFVGIDSGVRHAVSGASYGQVR